MYVRELVVRYRRRTTKARLPDGFITTATAAASFLTQLLQDEPVQVAVLLCLSTELELLAYHELARGTLDTAIVHPRDVYRTALLANAGSVILGHNHPGGYPEPSAQDAELTGRLVAAGTLIGIELRDHIIIGDHDRWFSFKQAGQL